MFPSQLEVGLSHSSLYKHIIKLLCTPMEKSFASMVKFIAGGFLSVVWY